MRPVSNHVPKFYGDRPRDLGDYAFYLSPPVTPYGRPNNKLCLTHALTKRKWSCFMVDHDAACVLRVHPSTPALQKYSYKLAISRLNVECWVLCTVSLRHLLQPCLNLRRWRTTVQAAATTITSIGPTVFVRRRNVFTIQRQGKQVITSNKWLKASQIMPPNLRSHDL